MYKDYSYHKSIVYFQVNSRWKIIIMTSQCNNSGNHSNQNNKHYSKNVLGIDIGTTTVKVALLEEDTREVKKTLSRWVD